MFNPLRPHIVQLQNNTYAVRRWAWTGWKYFDNQHYGKDQYWWPARYAHKWATLPTLEAARELLVVARFSLGYDSGKYIEG